MGALISVTSNLIFIFIYIHNMKRITPMIIINSIWTVAIILSKIGFYNLIIPNETTYILIFIILYIFNISYVFSRAFYVKRKKINWNNQQTKSKEITKIKTKTFIKLQIILILIMMPFFLKVLKLGAGSNFSIIREEIYSTSGNGILTGRYDNLIWFTLVTSLVVSFMILAVYCFYTRQLTNISFLLTLIVIIIFSWVSAGRIMFVRFAIFFIIGFPIFKDSFSKKVLIKLNRRVKCILGVSIVVILVLTNLRSSYYDESIVFWIVSYLSGPIIFMNQIGELLSGYKIEFLYGKVLVGGALYYPSYYINKIFGTHFKLSIESLSFLNIPINIRLGNKSLMYNSLGSGMLNLYFDGGVFAICIGFILLSIAIALVEINIAYKLTIQNFIYYCLIIYVGFYTLFRWEPMNIWIWGSLLGSLIVGKIVSLKGERNEKGINNK